MQGFIRKFAVQGHAIPETVMRPQGPFPPEVLAQTRVVHQQYDSDSLHEALDNVRLFMCKLCGEYLLEEQLDIHECEEE